MAEVNGRLFLNNVSLGVYGDAVRQPTYRDAKARTLLETAAQVSDRAAAAPTCSSWTTAADPSQPAGRARLEQPLLARSAAMHPARGRSSTAGGSGSSSWIRRSRPEPGADVDRRAGRRDRARAGPRRNRRRGGRPRPAAPLRDPSRRAPRPDLVPARGRVALRTSKPADLRGRRASTGTARVVRRRGASPSACRRARRRRRSARPCAARASRAALRARRRRRRPPPPRARP